MQDLSSSRGTKKQDADGTNRQRDIVFLSVLIPVSVGSLAAYFLAGEVLTGAHHSIFLLAPAIVAVVWLAYEQMHDLVWWNLHPLCPTCRRSFHGAERPKPGMICECCNGPLYPLRTSQDFKVIVLVTSITVIALPVYALWASLVAQLAS